MTKIIIKRSNRRTISLSVEKDGIVLVRAPRYVSDVQINKFIAEKRDWLTRRLKEMKQRKDNAARFRELIDINQIKNYREKARLILTDRTNYFAEQFRLSFKSLRISSAGSRWGSCSGENSLNFNWKILFAPPKVQDYLVAHELAHTIHKNHKKRFWALVEKMHPEFKDSRKWLRENTHLLEI